MPKRTACVKLWAAPNVAQDQVPIIREFFRDNLAQMRASVEAKIKEHLGPSCGLKWFKIWREGDDNPHDEIAIFAFTCDDPYEMSDDEVVERVKQWSEFNRSLSNLVADDHGADIVVSHPSSIGMVNFKRIGVGRIPSTMKIK